MNQIILSNQEMRRYRRHIALPHFGIEGQHKLKSAKILVAGAGSLGSLVLQNLCSSGIGHIGIIDDDKVEDQSLLCQYLYNNKDIGKHKSIVAKEKLGNQNNHLSIEIYNIRLKDDDYSEQIINRYDIVIDSTGNAKSKEIIHNLCIKQQKTLLIGIVEQYCGRILLFDNQDISSGAMLYYEEGNLDEQRRNNRGKFLPVNAIIASFISSETIKILSGVGEVSFNKMMQFNALDNSFEIEELK